MDNNYNFSVHRQNSEDVIVGKSPIVTIRTVKDETVRNISLKNNRSDFLIVLRELRQVIRLKDKKSIFANPVTESQAPNYFKIIEKAMDLQTIGENIEKYVYSDALSMLEDVIVMCQNALVYNTAETVYYKKALQMLKYIKRLFSKDSLQRLSDNLIFRQLLDDEIGDINSCLRYLKNLHLQAARLRPGKSLHNDIQIQFRNYRTKPFIQTPSHDNDINPRRRSTIIKTEDIYYQSAYYQSDEAESSTHDVDMSKDDENMSVPIKEATESVNSDSENNEDVLESVLLASELARKKLDEKYQKLNKKQRVLFLTDNVDETDPKSLYLKDQSSNETFKLSDKFGGMVKDIQSVDVNSALMEGVSSSFTAQHLCYSPGENVSLTTSRPLHLYCVPEQAVFVETFGDVATAEYACNMHYFVKGLPRNSLAVKTVKNRLNACTNYLTFGVDQIIMKRLKNMPPICMD